MTKHVRWSFLKINSRNKSFSAVAKPTARVSVLTVALCVVCAFVFVSVAGISYANGFSFGEPEVKVEDKAATSATDFDEDTTHESDALKATTKRDVSALYNEIKDEEDEKARIEAEKKRKHDNECINRGVSNKAAAGNPNDGVDFTIGRDKFVSLWGARINAYLAGSALDGYGETFANAAFEYGVDPRVSPAISNTESTKGANCFRSHNAWGWMGTAHWSDWETAIDAHVSGFASGYGYTVTLSAAKKYCPPTYEDWYGKTISQIALI